MLGLKQKLGHVKTNTQPRSTISLPHSC